MEEKKIEIPAEIRTFLFSILQEANFTLTDEEIVEEMILEMFKRLDAFLITKILEYLPEEKVEGFLTLNEGGTDPNGIQMYLEAHLPNHKDIFMIAFNDFRNMYLETILITRATDGIGNSETNDALQSLASGTHAAQQSQTQPQ